MAQKKTYSEAFKRDAIRLQETSGKSISSIENIWVGKEVLPGEALGTLGRNNERHLHFEVRSFGADDLSEYNQNVFNEPLSGIIPSGTSPDDTSPPYIYDPIQFLPYPTRVLQPISGVQIPEETFHAEYDRQFFESVATNNIIEYGTHLGENIHSVYIRISDDCIVRYMVNLDPRDIETMNGYRGFLGYPDPDAGRNLVPPIEITNSAQ